jgi:hypothetical protein
MKFRITFEITHTEFVEASPEYYPEYEGDWEDEDDLHDHILDVEKANAEAFLLGVLEHEEVGVDVTVERDAD